MQNIKRWISLALVVCLLAMSPAAALAEDTETGTGLPAESETVTSPSPSSSAAAEGETVTSPSPSASAAAEAHLIRKLFNAYRCGPPSRVTGTSSWTSVDHSVSRLPPRTCLLYTSYLGLTKKRQTMNDGNTGIRPHEGG